MTGIGPERSDQTIRVATWNIWWRHGAWEARQPAIVECLRGVDADIVALQEVSTRDPDQRRWIEEELGYHVTSAPDGPDDRFAVGNLIASRWPLHETGWAFLDVGEMPPHRTVVQASVASPYGVIPVACTHLSHGFDQSELRCRQLRQIAERLAGHVGSDGFPPLLLGDLNAVPDSDELRMLTGRASPAAPGMVFTDVWEQKGRGLGETYSDRNPHVNDSAWPERRLDYVLVGWPRERPVGNPHEVALFGHQPIRGTVASDHYGVVADLRV